MSRVTKPSVPVEDLSLPSKKESRVRMRVPGTIFEVDEEGVVRVPEDYLKKLLDNRSQ